MKRKGFTLIELLAVIVVLSIIALIAVPIVLNLINDAKLGAAKSSAIGYMESVKQSVILGKINPDNGINIPDSNEITTGDDSDIELDKVDVSGSLPDYVTISFENENIKTAGLCINGYNIDYKDGKADKSNTNYCKFVSVKDLKINNEDTQLKVGKTLKINYSISPSDVVPLFSSSNESVAIVSTDGVVTAKSSGTTKISVRAGTKRASFNLNVVVNDSLIGYVSTYSGNKEFNDIIKINDISYSAHIYSFDGDQTWSSDMVFGNDSDVATESEYAKNMVIVKVNGNLTIDENVTVKPYSTIYGGPKGFLLYVSGTLTNNGIIDNSHGAKAVGENVYLWKNENDTYEYVPANGASGAAAANSSKVTKGYDGSNGSKRSTAGGASGGPAYKMGTVAGAGSSGTSYSGGTGGGGAYYEETAEDGKANGGAGGAGKGYDAYSWSCGGGAGNPGGANANKSGTGSNGTGGLLIIYSNDLINNGTIQANGSAGATAYRAGGGGSGAGSINIFYANSITKGTITATGGAAGLGTRNGESANAGKGGDGSITIGSISTESFVVTK